MQRTGSNCATQHGLGKTRVILPMLLIEWYYSKVDHVAVVFLLSQLLDEGFSYLHQHLCASVHNICLATAPFSRDAKLNHSSSKQLCHLFQYLRSTRTVLVQSPEHRLSMLLKCNEAIMDEMNLPPASTPTISMIPLMKTLLSVPLSVFFDECDEIMRYVYQLIYSMGLHVEDVSQTVRWRTVQAVLGVLASDAAMSFLVDSKALAVLEFQPSKTAYRAMRLVQCSDSEWKDACRCLVDELIRNPPPSLKWLTRLADSNPVHVDLLKSFMVDQYTGSSDVKLDSLTEQQQHQLLTIRGLLACGALKHCLSLRHGVNYGLDTRPERKRLAVPYDACDSPSERTEFAHPDCATVFTHLSYYSVGLTRVQIADAFHILLQLPRAAQQRQYHCCFEAAKFGLEEPQLYDSIDKIDISSSVQLTALAKIFRYNVPLIDFWLTRITLPQDTRNYSAQLVSNSWHLANVTRCVGFSGTNDSNDLLPLLVHPVDMQNIPELAATNGKMIDLIISQSSDRVEYIQVAVDDQGADIEQWKLVTQRAVERGCHALLDAGALLSGPTNRQVAAYVLSLLCSDGDQKTNRHGLLGVTYYDRERNQWVFENFQRQVFDHAVSPVPERDSFVYYSQKHTRGVDMKLRPDACALLTVGPGLRKDQLMQAAGRLRQLEFGQKLVLAYCRDIAHLIDEQCHVAASSSDNGLSAAAPVHVLQFVLDETVKYVQNGLVHWATQGLHFASTERDPGKYRQAEPTTLHEMYEGKHIDQTVAVTVGRKCENAMIESNTDENAKMKILVEQIRDRVQSFGADVVHTTTVFGAEITNLGNECEREQQQEQEQELENEKEQESQHSNLRACEEEEWGIASYLEYDADSATMLPTEYVKSISAYFEEIVVEDQAKSMLLIDWPNTIYVTVNFARTLASSDPLAPEGDGSGRCQTISHGRIAGSIVCFPDGTVLLISEREAEVVMREVWMSNWWDKDDFQCVQVAVQGNDDDCDMKDCARAHCMTDVPILLQFCYLRDAMLDMKFGTNTCGHGTSLKLPCRDSTMSLDVELENDAVESDGIGYAPHAVCVSRRTVSMLQLFNGETCRYLDSTAVRAALNRCDPVQHITAKLGAHELVIARGFRLQYEDSDLQLICQGTEEEDFE
jgi:Protein of unknown function (DUF3638)/Protein of unknown function (DUF3645)